MISFPYVTNATIFSFTENNYTQHFIAVNARLNKTIFQNGIISIFHGMGAGYKFRKITSQNLEDLNILNTKEAINESNNSYKNFRLGLEYTTGIIVRVMPNLCISADAGVAQSWLQFSIVYRNKKYVK